MKLSNDFSKGMLRYFNNLKHDKDFYSFALNISPVDNISDRTTKQNERKYQTYLDFLFGQGYSLIGYQWLGTDSYVFFVLTDNNQHQIWYIDSNTSEVRYSNPYLEFRKENPIKSTYRENYKGERIIYFVDGYNEDRVINIDTVQATDNINTLSINPVYSNLSKFKAKVLSNGGVLKAGKYSVIISFKDKNLQSSIENFQINNLFIEEGNYHEDFEGLSIDTLEDLREANNSNMDTSIKGLSGGTRTSKAIQLEQDSFDLDNYPLIDIYLIRQNETSTEVLLLEDYQNKEKIILTGNEAYQNLGDELSAIIIRNANYNKSNAITQFNNRLVRANTSTQTVDQSFQEIANNIKVTYKEKHSLFNFDGLTSDPNSKYSPIEIQLGSTIVSSKERNRVFDMSQYNSNPYYLANRNMEEKTSATFLRDEVYALGVYFELDNGEFTSVYHIPGRLPNELNSSSTASDEYGRNTSISNWDKQTLSIEGETREAWELINTATRRGSGNNYSGDLGYYRTEDTYPEGYGFPSTGDTDSNGRVYIRHHRMPSEKLSPSTILKPVGGIYGSKNSLFRNDIQLEFELPELETEVASKIKNVFFTSARRGELDKKVISHGLATLVTKKNNDTTTLRNTADLGKPASGTSVDPMYYEFISPEINFKFKETNISGAYIKPNRLLKSRTLYLSKTVNTSNFSEGLMFASYMNREGYKVTGPFAPVEYEYKEEFMANHSYFGNPRELPSFKQFRINDFSFIEDNFEGNAVGMNIDFRGSQKTSLMSLVPNQDVKNYLGFTYTDFGSFLPEGFSHLTKFHGSADTGVVLEDRDIRGFKYYDSFFYSTILSNNKNIFSDVLFLEYNTLHNKEESINTYTVYGDAYIENHISKKSYSKPVDANSAYLVASGGDITSKDVLYTATIVGAVAIPNVQYINNYLVFPTNTFLNIRLRKRDTPEQLDYPEFIQKEFPANEAEKRSRIIVDYQLESVFQNENSIDPMFANDIKFEYSGEIKTIKELPSRIVYSDIQNFESDIDSYRVTRVNNYKDLPSHKGFISHLFTKDGNLYAVTRDSIFVLFADQSQIQVSSGEQISIGTGDFLSGGQQELISTEGGFGGCSSKLGLVETPYGVLMVDILRDKILLLDEGLGDINAFSLEEKFNNQLIERETDFKFDYPLLKQGVTVGYDANLHRFLITDNRYNPLEEITNNYEGEIKNNTSFINGKYYYNKGTYNYYSSNTLTEVDYNNKDLFENKSKTISFDPVLKSWLSYHTYFPTVYIPKLNSILFKEDNSINGFIEEYEGNFILETVFNEYQKDNKVFDSLEFYIESENTEGEIIDKFLDKIIVYNDTQITEEIKDSDNKFIKRESLYKTNNLLDISKDSKPIKLFKEDWESIKDNYFIDKVINPNALNLSKPWYSRGRLRSHYIKVRAYGDPLDNSKIIISFMNANIRPSIR